MKPIHSVNKLSPPKSSETANLSATPSEGNSRGSEALQGLLNTAFQHKDGMKCLVMQYGSDGAILSARLHQLIAEIKKEILTSAHQRTNNFEEQLNQIEREIQQLKCLPSNFET